MSITLIRVVNQQSINRSILLDKLDDGQANTEGYANLQKQKVYIPYSNPVDPSVKGYVDFVPSDRVLLSAHHGTIRGLSLPWNIHGFVSTGVVSTFAFDSALISTPVVTLAANAAGQTTIDGTTFLSVTPDVTYVTLTNLTGGTQRLASSAFSVFTATQIVILDGSVTIGVPGAGWKVVVQANSKTSNTYTI